LKGKIIIVLEIGKKLFDWTRNKKNPDSQRFIGLTIDFVFFFTKKTIFIHSEMWFQVKIDHKSPLLSRSIRRKVVMNVVSAPCYNVIRKKKTCVLFCQSRDWQCVNAPVNFVRHHKMDSSIYLFFIKDRSIFLLKEYYICYIISLVSLKKFSFLQY